MANQWPGCVRVTNNKMIKTENNAYITNMHKSPITELLQWRRKLSSSEMLANGRCVPVSVDIFSKGEFKGIGRNDWIAKSTAEKCALRAITKHHLKFSTKHAATQVKSLVVRYPNFFHHLFFFL